MLDPDKVDQRELSRLVDLDQDIKIAVVVIVPSGTRAEHGKMRHAVFCETSAQAPQALDESIPLYSYSAASRAA